LSTIPAPAPVAPDAAPQSPLLSGAKGERVWFHWLCKGSAWASVFVLGLFLLVISVQAAPWLNLNFLTSPDSNDPEKAGILYGLWGSFWTICLMVVFAVPVGICAGIYLEEYSTDSWLTRVIRVNLTNLAGVPSIVYGILGLTVFVRMFGMYHPRDNLVFNLVLFELPLPFGPVVLSAALTLGLLILPVIIVATQEAIRAVPASIRHASLALGATRWQTISKQVLPVATPGILRGVILAMSRAIGETAPLVLVGAATAIAIPPGGIESPVDIVTNPASLLDVPFSMFTAIPMQIYGWATESRRDFHGVAAAGILVLLLMLLTLNGIAIYIRNRYQRKLKW
jgi:phosphate transport system permease protein